MIVSRVRVKLRAYRILSYVLPYLARLQRDMIAHWNPLPWSNSCELIRRVQNAAGGKGEGGVGL